MCDCVDVEPGTYSNSVSLPTPWRYSTGCPKLATIDRCLQEEIKGLWARGIRTLECCCGHGRNQGYIAVYDDYINAMLTLGYEQLDREDLFLPKAFDGNPD